MDNQNIKKDKLLWYSTLCIFVLYIIVLLRITLFKQVPMYNLLAAIGASERTISIIPFKSIFDMISTDVSMLRIIEHTFGNIAIFIPFGLLFPILLKEKTKNTILYGIFLSLFIEIVQFIFELGSTDIDDLIFNGLGAAIGYVLYKVIKKNSNSNTSSVISIIVLISVFGSISFGMLFVNYTELFMISPKTVKVENEEIVQDFIDTKPYISGKFVEFDGRTLIIEKHVGNAAKQMTLIEMAVIPESKIYVRSDTTAYFFSAISEEHTSYEQLFYSDFVSAENKMFSKENNILAWSSDGENIDNLVIIKWAE